jgi:hypothetical protein
MEAQRIRVEVECDYDREIDNPIISLGNFI